LFRNALTFPMAGRGMLSGELEAVP
jgi:hypothetical protein